MQKSGFPKMRHYVGFWQIGSQMLGKNQLYGRILTIFIVIIRTNNYIVEY